MRRRFPRYTDLPKRKIEFQGMGMLRVGEWHSGSLNIVSKKIGKVDPGSFISKVPGIPLVYRVHSHTVGMFTGLLDRKKGDKGRSKIYEGDIVAAQGHLQSKDKKTVLHGVIVYDEKMAAFCFNTYDKQSYLLCEMRKPLLKIGNIHDNGRLVTPKKD
jgi:hypothetical protein